MFTETGLPGRASALHQRGAEEKKGGGFHQPADAASPETCCSNCSFCSSSCSADSFCEDRTVRARRHQNIKRAAGTRSPGGQSEAKEFHPRLESKSPRSTKGGGASSVTSESVTSEWITAVSLLTTCLHALIRRSPHNLRRLISTHRKHEIGPLLLPNSCYLRCDRCLPDRPPPHSHTHSPPPPRLCLHKRRLRTL